MLRGVGKTGSGRSQACSVNASTAALLITMVLSSWASDPCHSVWQEAEMGKEDAKFGDEGR